MTTTQKRHTGTLLRRLLPDMGLQGILLLLAAAVFSGCSLGQDFDDIQACGDRAVLNEDGECVCPNNLLATANGDCLCVDRAIYDSASQSCACEDGSPIRPDGQCGCPVELTSTGEFAVPGNPITECSGRIEVLTDLLGEPGAELISADILVDEVNQTARLALLQLDGNDRLFATMARVDYRGDSIQLTEQNKIFQPFEDLAFSPEGFPFPDVPLAVGILADPREGDSPRVIVVNRFAMYEADFTSGEFRLMRTVDRDGRDIDILDPCDGIGIPGMDSKRCFDDVQFIYSAATAVRSGDASALSFVGFRAGENPDVYEVGTVIFVDGPIQQSNVVLLKAQPLANSVPVIEDNRATIISASPLVPTSGTNRFVAAANETVLEIVEAPEMGCPDTCAVTVEVRPTVLDVTLTSDLSEASAKLGTIENPLVEETLVEGRQLAASIVEQVVPPSIIDLGEAPLDVVHPLAIAATESSGAPLSIWQTAAWLCPAANGGFPFTPCDFSASPVPISLAFPLQVPSGFIEWTPDAGASTATVLEDTTVLAVASLDPTLIGGDPKLDTFAAVGELNGESGMIFIDFSNREISPETVFLQFPFTPREDAFRVGLFTRGPLVVVETSDGIQVVEVTTAP